MLNSKNPQVKEGALKFLARCLSTSTTPVPPPQLKPLSESLAALLEDSFEGARNEAATCLGTLMKMVGERPLNALMDGLADVRKTKVKEAYEKATVKAKAGTGGPSRGPPVAKEPPKKVSSTGKKPEAVKAPTLLAGSPSEDDVLSPAENRPLKKPPTRLLVRFCMLSFMEPFIFMVKIHRQRKQLVLNPTIRQQVLLLLLQPRERYLQRRLQSPNQRKVELLLSLVHWILSNIHILRKMLKSLLRKSYLSTSPPIWQTQIGRPDLRHWKK